MVDQLKADRSPNQTVEFLTTLFPPGRCVLVRPIETWDDEKGGEARASISRASSIFFTACGGLQGNGSNTPSGSRAVLRR